MSQRLNRCPACQSAQVTIHRLDLLPKDAPEGEPYYAECDACGHYGPDAGTEYAARRAWNQQALKGDQHG